MISRLAHFARMTSIRFRVLAGFGSSLILLGGVAVIYDQELRGVRDQVAAVSRAAEASDGLSRFSQSVMDMRRLVSAYLAKPGAAEQLAAVAAQGETLKRAEALKAFVDDRASMFRDDMALYRAAFDRVVAGDRRRQASLSSLTAAGARLTNYGSTIVDATIATGDPAARTAARFTEAVQAFMGAASRVMLRSTAGDQDVASFELERVRRELKDLQAEPPAVAKAAALVGQAGAPVDKLSASFAALMESADVLSKERTTLGELADNIGTKAEALRHDYLALRNDTIERTQYGVNNALGFGIAGSLCTLVLGVVVAMLIAGSISTLVRRMTTVMAALAGDDLAVTVPGMARRDEIGAMARAVQTFKENGLRLRDSEARAATARERSEAERRRADEAKAVAAHQLADVVEGIGRGLDQLARGALTFRLDRSFAADYEKLRLDFNDAMAKLADTLTVVASNTSAIRSGTGEISTAADDLSRRTEQQAASLEETAAALDEVTATVKKTSQSALQARDVVGAAKDGAERSGAVVRRAVEAMDGIARSSREIGQIIGVIDEIAFQTNLLALNAGVEAARAGDAGRGFAVVASEVRALAQRSAEAAKEIKGLVTASGRQVEQGVDLVGATGRSLDQILGQVAELNTLVTEIAASAQEQASGLDQINTAINQMDQVTQQNAAMVEESTAASRALARETEELAGLVGRFELGGRGAASPARAGRPGPAPVAMLKTTGRGGAALKPAVAAPNDWQEF